MKTIKMADAFGKLAGICAGLEGRYTPAHQNLLPSSLAAQLTGAQAALESVNTAEREMRNAVAERAQAFQDLVKLASRIRILLEVDPAMSSTLADADLPLKKLALNRYKKALKRPESSAEGESSTRSYARGTDYLSRIAHLEHVVEALRQNPAYKANAPDLTVNALTDRLIQMKALQQKFTAAETDLEAKRSVIRMVFHAPFTGIAATGTAVRKSICSQFGLRSPEAVAIKGIRFK